jgi:hypothetical protein
MSIKEITDMFANDFDDSDIFEEIIDVSVDISDEDADISDLLNDYGY